MGSNYSNYNKNIKYNINNYLKQCKLYKLKNSRKTHNHTSYDTDIYNGNIENIDYKMYKPISYCNICDVVIFINNSHCTNCNSCHKCNKYLYCYKCNTCYNPHISEDIIKHKKTCTFFKHMYK